MHRRAIAIYEINRRIPNPIDRGKAVARRIVLCVNRTSSALHGQIKSPLCALHAKTSGTNRRTMSLRKTSRKGAWLVVDDKIDGVLTIEGHLFALMLTDLLKAKFEKH